MSAQHEQELPRRRKPARPALWTMRFSLPLPSILLITPRPFSFSTSRSLQLTARALSTFHSNHFPFSVRPSPVPHFLSQNVTEARQSRAHKAIQQSRGRLGSARLPQHRLRAARRGEARCCAVRRGTALRDSELARACVLWRRAQRAALWTRQLARLRPVLAGPA